MTASRTNRCPVKWSTKPENTKMVGKFIVVIIYIYIYSTKFLRAFSLMQEHQKV